MTCKLRLRGSDDKGESRPSAPPHARQPCPGSVFLFLINMDDDIQFLGMVSPISTSKPYSITPHSSMQPPASGASLTADPDTAIAPRILTFPLIGIMLVIPKNGDEPTQTLRFLKSTSAVVHIGRASSSLTEAEKSPDSIQFRCPVISRRHAKLMFSSGHVCPPLSVSALL